MEVIVTRGEASPGPVNILVGVSSGWAARVNSVLKLQSLASLKARVPARNMYNVTTYNSLMCTSTTRI